MKPQIAISTIPEQFRPSFIRLGTLTDDQFVEIKAALSDAPFSVRVRSLSDALSAQVHSIAPTELHDILAAAASLLSVLERYEISPEELSKTIRGLLMGYDPATSPEMGDAFADRLLILLRSSQLYLAAKAGGLLTDNNSSYLSARIISDMRPLFGLSADKEPEAALIVHSLHVHALSGSGDEEDIYVALDSRDLQDLISVLERAVKKEKLLASFMEHSKITALDLQDE